MLKLSNIFILAYMLPITCKNSISELKVKLVFRKEMERVNNAQILHRKDICKKSDIIITITTQLWI